MNLGNPFRKGTILIPTGPCDHLHIICNNPVFYPKLAKECVLAVNISTVTTDIPYDISCILNTGDHPFINRQSYVYYRKADIFGATAIAKNVADGSFTTHQPIDDTVFSKVLLGFSISDEVTPKIRQFYKSYCI